MTEIIAINTLPDAVTTTNDQTTILKRLFLLRIDRGPGKKRPCLSNEKHRV